MKTTNARWVAIRITFADGSTVEDEIRGFSSSDALFNAVWNWPAATHIEVA